MDKEILFYAVSNWQKLFCFLFVSSGFHGSGLKCAFVSGLFREVQKLLLSFTFPAVVESPTLIWCVQRLISLCSHGLTPHNTRVRNEWVKWVSWGNPLLSFHIS